MPVIYKICGRDEWENAMADGFFRGSGADLGDGFIHFSAAHQLRETARRHFSGRADLVLVAVDAATLGEELKWEKSRGGDLFPHLYGPLDAKRVQAVMPLPWRGAEHDFPHRLAE